MSPAESVELIPPLLVTVMRTHRAHSLSGVEIQPVIKQRCVDLIAQAVAYLSWIVVVRRVKISP